MQSINKNTISNKFTGWMAVLLCGIFFLQPYAVVSADPLLIVNEGNGVNEDNDDPLDDPWIKFCLFNADARDLDDCINGWPAKPGNGIYKIVRKHSYELTLISDDLPQAATLSCPHEFGKACQHMIDAVYAFNGSCKKTLNNTVCHLPE